MSNEHVKHIRTLIPHVRDDERKGYSRALRDIQLAAGGVPVAGIYVDEEVASLARMISKATAVPIAL